MFSTKVALICCVSFICAMCSLVTQVARPLIEQPNPLTVASRDRGEMRAEVDRPAGGAEVLVVRGFGRRSPVGSDRDMTIEEPSPALATRIGVGREGVLPSPVVDRNAPVIVDVDARWDEDAPQLVEGDSGSADRTVPEAVVVESPSRGLHLLAALTPVEAGPGVAPPEKATPPELREYTVKPGDSLVKIARRFWSDDSPEVLAALAEANPRISKRRDRIFVGEVLRIPRLAGTLRQSVSASDQTGELARHLAAKPAGRKVRRYTVRRGDSLAGIARRMLDDPERWREIAALNGLRDAHRIIPGTRIVLPPPRHET